MWVQGGAYMSLSVEQSTRVRMRMTWKKALADSAQKPHRIVLVLQSTVAWHTSGSLGL